MKKFKKIIFNAFTVCMIGAAFASAMTFRNVTKEAVAIFIGSVSWLAITAIEAEKKEGDAV